MTGPSADPGAPVGDELLDGGSVGLEGEDWGSGYLSAISRSAALAAALPFVATYFVRSDRLRLHAAAVVGSRSVNVLDRRSVPSDPMLASIRLRVALVAGRQLADLLRAVLRRSNFRYKLVRNEHVGHLHGRLDVAAYLQQRHRRSVPRRYPVVDLERSSATPENILAAFALHWLIAELDASFLRVNPYLPDGTPESREVARVRGQLVRLGTHPTLRGASEAAERVTRRETAGRLFDTVQARIGAGHVTRAGGYEQLLDWVRAAMTGEPLAAPGDWLAEFYGSEFDDKLFELWCLRQTADALTTLLGHPRLSAPHLLNRDARSPLYVWAAGAALVELYFQPSLSDLVGAPNRWRYEPADRQLRGFPDIGMRCRGVDGSVEVVLLDAKLRRRRSARGQEMYKLLGYFANAGRPVHYGALVFHEPEGFHGPDGHRLESLSCDASDETGRVVAVAVDPSDQVGNADAFAVLARLAVMATGVPEEQVHVLSVAIAEDDDDEEEISTSRSQVLAVAQLTNMARQLPPQVLEATAAHLHAVLEDTWLRLGSDVQRMVVTAAHFGVTAPHGADLAGPILGLCASVERLLCDRVATPALAGISDRAGRHPDSWTLGTLLARLGEALDQPRGATSRALRDYLHNSQYDLVALNALIPELDRLRARHRNKAAHMGLLDRPQWNEVYRLIVLRAEHALLPRLVDALTPAADR